MHRHGSKRKKKLSGWKYIYGPVRSWRLGRSLGIDLISRKNKICNFNCVYCQLGETINFSDKRKIYVSIGKVLKELISFPNVKIDYITFSGMGEPTLAKNLGKAIAEIKKVRKEPVAVLTNASLLNRKDVRKDLMAADFVIAKLDSYSENSFQKINKAHPSFSFSDIVEGIKKFRKEYHKKFALQLMFVDANKDQARKLAQICREIKPDEVYINTPLRPCAVKCLSRPEIKKLRKQFVFKDIKALSIYETGPTSIIRPVDRKNTFMRRGEI